MMFINRAPINTMLLLSTLFFATEVLSMQGLDSAARSKTTRTLLFDEVKEKYTSVESKFINIEGVDFHYKDEGEGPALLLLHGTLGDLRDWDGWSEELKKDFRVIRFDMPGFGITGAIANKNYSIERLHSLIDTFMDQLGVEKFGIVGISYGGIVTFRYAATRTDRVTSMILINSAGIQTGKRVVKKEVASSKPPKNIFMDPVVNKQDIEGFYQGYINDPAKRTPELIQRKLDFLNIVGRNDEAKSLYSFYSRNDPFGVLAHVKAPSLIMWGGGNKALDTETAQLFMGALKNACAKKLVTFEQGGHYINVERPIETAKAAKAFLISQQNNPNQSCSEC